MILYRHSHIYTLNSLVNISIYMIGIYIIMYYVLFPTDETAGFSENNCLNGANH